MNLLINNNQEVPFRPLWLYLALMVLFVASALPFINPVTPRLNSDVLAFIGLGLFGWVTHIQWSKVHKEPVVQINALALLAVFWTVWACVQYITGINTTFFSYLLVSISYFLGLVLLCIWVDMWVQADRVHQLTQAVMACVLIAGLLEALGIWMQMLQIQDWLSPWLNMSASFPRHGGFISQTNLAATLMVCALVSLVFCFPSNDEGAAQPSAWRLAAMVFLMLAIYGTNSRTGYLEVLVISGLLALLRKRLHVSWVWVAMVVWLMLVIAVGEVIGGSMGLLASQQLQESSDAVKGSSAHRLRILADMWQLIKAHPFVGVGWRQLQVNGVLTPTIDDPADHAHNLFVQIQVELGLPGTLSLLALIAYVLLKNKPWQGLSAERAAMMCVVIALLIHSMLEYPLWHALFLFLFGFAFTLLVGGGHRMRIPVRLLQLACAGWLVLTSWFFIDHQNAVGAYQRFGQNRVAQELIESNKTIWWNKLLFESIFMVNTPVNDNTRALLRKIAKVNANVFSQTSFVNLPLLEVMIQDREFEVANQLLRRLCLSLPQTASAIQIHLAQSKEPAYSLWLGQLPPNIKNCSK